MGFFEFLLAFFISGLLFKLSMELIDRIQELKLEDLKIKGAALQYQQDQVDRLLQAPRE